MLSTTFISLISNSEVAANTNGTSYLRLMENAGAACSKAIRDKFGISEASSKNVTVVCGRGNNGGDGFVIARKLHEYGCNVTIILAGGLPHTEQSKEMFSRIEQMPINIIGFDVSKSSSLDTLLNSDIIVEAVFGIGLEREVDLLLSSPDGRLDAFEIKSGKTQIFKQRASRYL